MRYPRQKPFEEKCECGNTVLHYDGDLEAPAGDEAFLVIIRERLHGLSNSHSIRALDNESYRSSIPGNSCSGNDCFQERI